MPRTEVKPPISYLAFGGLLRPVNDKLAEWAAKLSEATAAQRRKTAAEEDGAFAPRTRRTNNSRQRA